MLGTNELYNASMNMRALALGVECVVNCQRLHEECKDDVDVLLKRLMRISQYFVITCRNVCIISNMFRNYYQH